MSEVLIHQELFRGIFGEVAKFLSERGCPLTDAQVAALDEAVAEMVPAA